MSGGPLEGLRVLDASTLYAGPFAAMLLGDFGADVIKVEHPRGDPLRTHGYAKDGHGLWWKMLGRNKHAITLNFSKPAGQQMLLKLVADADVLIENFRPGVMEKWSLGYDELAAVNPGLVMLRLTGFGQHGPYSRRPGFGTLAESMSGWANNNGQPDGPPTLPPFGLADGCAGLSGALATMMAIHHRHLTGRGQVLDVALIEPILTVLGSQPTVYDQLGIIPHRLGNRSPNSSPRGIYKTSDNRWLAIAASAQTVAERVMTLVGHPEVIDEPWFKFAGERAKHADELDEKVAAWIGERPSDEVIRAFEEAEAAVAPIYDVSQVMADPQYEALESIVTVEDQDLGPIKMQNVLFRMLETPGSVRFTGRHLGQDNERIYRDLVGATPEQLDELRAYEVI